MVSIGTCLSTTNKKDMIFKGLKKLKSKTNIHFEHFIYSSHKEMLQNYPNNLDILILEIDVYDIKYLNLLSTINKIDKDVHILIFSNTSLEFNTTYNIKNITYLFNIVDKDIFDAFFEKCVIKIQNSNVNKNTLVFAKKNHLVKIAKESITYIETETGTRNIIIYYEDKSYTLKCPISQIERELNSDLFFKCHKSYIVNINKIVKIDNRLAYLNDGNYIPIGRNSVKQLKYILSSSMAG
ncbi:LytR/AlgR family response regulator transcription factor [Paraclostridium sordellii]|uniref:LytR/AlgR family response regulator transcription factor n=1 Tax=Paraclostridium sordellii TaxID=1505 RepID=UPI0005408DA0|nr:LytTR family DNA-binding domain-containing protein [Paeniclostridium sordellii]MCH1964658.1 LytTR family transcriptional regulator [Paeniclostridium sordellii]MCQ4699153.1 LytTR family transcriptional regulator [Paeniclostridium sordellii]MDU6482812.1 LytTR family DNA-binding domain-containing protein [Paeniclostridium sordellii]CEK39990.1 hypothetical protein JGS6382_33181 [[Clostridium] sordellii] [Paeniclostridium sordellii]